MPRPLLKPQPPSTPTMDPHIISALSSLHTRLTRLENSNLLAGKEIHPDKETYQMQSLERLHRFIKELNLRRQSEGLPILNISNPFMPENVHVKYEINGPVILTYSTSNPAKRFDIVCIFLQKWTIQLSTKFNSHLDHSINPKTNLNQGGAPNMKRQIAEMKSKQLKLCYPCITLETNAVLPL
jgi:hypothetical protein